MARRMVGHPGAHDPRGHGDLNGALTIFNDPWGALVTTDLTIELILMLRVILLDCGRRGKMPWIWIVAPLLLGALSTLVPAGRSMDKDAPPALRFQVVAHGVLPARWITTRSRRKVRGLVPPVRGIPLSLPRDGARRDLEST